MSSWGSERKRTNKHRRISKSVAIGGGEKWRNSRDKALSSTWLLLSTLALIGYTTPRVLRRREAMSSEFQYLLFFGQLFTGEEFLRALLKLSLCSWELRMLEKIGNGSGGTPEVLIHYNSSLFEWFRRSVMGPVLYRLSQLSHRNTHLVLCNTLGFRWNTSSEVFLDECWKMMNESVLGRLFYS